jgi:hypothetical protein
MSPPSLSLALSLLLTAMPLLATAQTCKPASIPASTPTSQFTDHGDGTVTDQKTGLQWQRCAQGQTWNGSTCTGTVSTYNWQAALQRAVTVNSAGYAGHSDWRLPNSKELASIVELQCYGPAINLAVFPATANAAFWSSSPGASYGDYAWSVDFNYGNDFWGNKLNSFSVRLVRSGQ